MKSLRSLIIATSNNKFPDTTNKTIVWLEDLAAPYFILKDEGELITIASPLGGQIPLEANCESDLAKTEYTKRFKDDAQAMYHFAHSLPLTEINADDFDLVFLVGGYGAMLDFPDNKYLKEILETFDRQNKAIGFIGYAAAALLSLKSSTGLPFVEGKKITSFTNTEEALTNLNEKAPFALETKLISLGGIFSKGEDFKSYVLIDNNIITGQNPASAVDAAKQVLLFAKIEK